MAVNRSATGIAFLLVMMVVSNPGVAGEVVCPVCGETQDDEVLECPNDGTNLKLLGVPPPENGASSSDTPDSDDSNGNSASDADRGKGKPPVIKYKRHDKGGERRPVERPEGSGFSDRMSRIPREARVVVEPKPTPPPEAVPEEPFPEALDRDIKAEFNRRRQEMQDQRRATDLAEAGVEKRRETERTRLLNNLGAPLATFGGRIFWMGEGDHPGVSGGVEIDVNLARYRLRAGFSTLIGIRTLEARNELVFLENIAVGIQAPKRFSPYVVARGGAGVVKTERYRTDQVYLLTSLGLEAGVDSWITPWIAVTPSMGYMRCTLDNAYWHSFTGKISIGF